MTRPTAALLTRWSVGPGRVAGWRAGGPKGQRGPGQPGAGELTWLLTFLARIDQGGAGSHCPPDLAGLAARRIQGRRVGWVFAVAARASGGSAERPGQRARAVELWVVPDVRADCGVVRGCLRLYYSIPEMAIQRTDAADATVLQPAMVWRKAPANAVIMDGRVIPIVEEVGTGMAARILALSQRRVQALCDEGILVEGRDWRRAPTLTGRSHYQIRRAALVELAEGGRK